MNAPKVLVAGIGNVFLGDDAFGVEVVRRLAARPQAEGVQVEDFGIRGFDLACALCAPLDRAVLVDAVRRGGAPGTLYLLEAEPAPSGPPSFDAHGMDPAQVLRNVRALGGEPKRVLVVGCEPGALDGPGLSDAVAGALDEAVRMVEDAVRA